MENSGLRSSLPSGRRAAAQSARASRRLPPARRAAKRPDMTRADNDLDARGLLCPLPVLKARKRLLALAPGAVLRLTADDPAAVVDVPHFCAEAGHAIIEETATEDGARSWLIRRG